MTSLSAVRRCSTRPVAASTTTSSVVTAPLTTDSPSPQAALITTWSRRPEAGLAVNSTPAASASTISWITTARRTVAGSKPFRERYAMARAFHSDAQQSMTAPATDAGPETFR
jgi:hypothetical protein